MADRQKAAGTAADVAFLRRALIAVALGAVLLAVWKLADILLLLFGSVLVAVMLRAAAAPLRRWFGIGELWALALAGFLIGALVAVGLWFLGPELARQMHNVWNQLPAAFARIAAVLNIGSFADLLKDTSTASSLGTLVAGVFSWAATIVGALASLALVIFGGIYLASDPGLYRRGFTKLVPPSLRPNVDAALDDIGVALHRWLTGQALAMTLVGTLTGLGLWLVGVPSAFALGFIAGLAEFVPILGAIVAAIPALLIASGQDWETVLLAAAVFIVVQQIESNVITPLIADRMVSVAPAVGLFGVVAMGVLFGPLGLLFGFPLAIVLDVIIRRLYVHDTLGEPVQIVGEPAKPAAKQPPDVH